MVNSKDPELAQMFNLPMVSYQIANSNTTGEAAKKNNFYPLNNRYLSERKRAMGNDIETSEVLSLALVYIVSNNSFAKIMKNRKPHTISHKIRIFAFINKLIVQFMKWQLCI